MQQTPNILVIQADQMATGAIGAYGNPLADTPHMDALADRGSLFESAYTNFPLCAPSRFSMMSGQLCSKIAAFDNGAEFPSSIPTLAHYLRHLDYQTTLVGKMHFVGADQLHGFEERLTTDIYPSDFGWTGDWTEVRPKFGNKIETFTDAGVCLRNVQMEYDDEVNHRAKRKIYELARAKDPRPFLLFTSFTHPHDPFQCRPEHWDRYKHDDIPLPTVNTPQSEMDPYSRRLIAQYSLDGQAPSDEQIRICRHAYYGSVSYVDDIVGSLVATLKETGLYENTVIVITTDHGEMLGEHGLWYKKNFFEEACRIPLIISHPDMGGRRVPDNVSLVDLLPTLVSIAGDETLDCLVEPLDGESLLPLMSNTDAVKETPVYSENLAEGATTPLLMVKCGSLKYIQSAVDPNQLFDLENDPNEQTNQFDNPDYQEALKPVVEMAAKQWDVEDLNQQILHSQRRRLFLREVLQKGQFTDWDFVPTDQQEKHSLRADNVYGKWAYSDMVGFEIPKE
ncbi:MAG: choline-sulfatase [Pseudomonadota bacterium]